ncbi:MAG: cytochrome B [Bacteroidetes bacterium]|nr:MAG: cytochrome B [Bacteroidota bacterium]
MYNMLVHAHSGLRYLVLAFLLLAIITGWMKWSKQESYPAGKMPLLGLIFTHIQLILGLVLYFISPKVQFAGNVMKDAVYRFYTVEHISLMLVAIILITLGYRKAKQQAPQPLGHRTIVRYYLIGLVLILVSIPWPFRGLGAGWF